MYFVNLLKIKRRIRKKAAENELRSRMIPLPITKNRIENDTNRGKTGGWTAKKLPKSRMVKL